MATTTAVTQTKKAGVPTLRQQLESTAFAAQVAKALPRHLTPDRFIRVAATAIMRTPKLAQCDQVSFFNSLLTLSQLGLEPDGRRAHLIPFENRKRGCVECQLIVDYKGLVELALRSGTVANIHADVVCDADEFEYNCGEISRHKINFREPRGSVYAAYAICTFKDGTKKAEVMGRDEIEAIRSRSRAGQSGPWVTDWNEMSKKTVFRRLSKWLPLSPELRDAVEADDELPSRTVPIAAEVVSSVVTEPSAFVPVAAEVEPDPEPTPEPAPEPAKASAGEELGVMLESQGVKLGGFLAWLQGSPHCKGLSVDMIQQWADVPESAALAIGTDAKAMKEITIKFKG